MKMALVRTHSCSQPVSELRRAEKVVDIQPGLKKVRLRVFCCQRPPAASSVIIMARVKRREGERERERESRGLFLDP